MKLRLTALSLALLGLAAPAAAAAAKPSPLAQEMARIAATKKAKAKAEAPDPVVATFLSCGGDKLRIGVGAAAGKAGRKARGATINARAKVFPLVGEGVARPARDVGKAGTEDFAGLPASGYVGVVRWKLKKGSRTIASGIAHTDAVKVGGRKGVGVCSLPVGIPPKDVKAPLVFITSTDENWQRGPLTVGFAATDDLSGVQAVSSSLDGGPVHTGNALTIAAEGVHSVDYAARDAAGNTSASKRQTLRVDTGAPSAPNVTAPISTTGDSTPSVIWDPSTDSGSGVIAYFVEVRGAADQVVFFQPVSPGTTRADSAPLADGAYSVKVFAVDAVGFITPSQPRAFNIVSGNPTASLASTSPIVVQFDRPMDPGTVNDTSITVARTGGGSPSYAVGACSNSCTQTTVTLTSTPIEGTYTVGWNAPARSEEGAALTAGNGSFSRNAYANDFGGSCDFTGGMPPWEPSCSSGDLRTTSPVRCQTVSVQNTTYDTDGPAIQLVGSGNPIRVTFSYTLTGVQGGDHGRVFSGVNGGAPTTPQKDYTTNSSGTDSFTVPGGSTPVRVRFEHDLAKVVFGTSCAADGVASFRIDNVVVDRN